MRRRHLLVASLALLVSPSAAAPLTQGQLLIKIETLAIQTNEALELGDCIGEDYQASLAKLAREAAGEASAFGDGASMEVMTAGAEIARLGAAVGAKKGCTAAATEAAEAAGTTDAPAAPPPPPYASIVLGDMAGDGLENAPFDTIIGDRAAKSLSDAPYAITIGNDAGGEAAGANYGVMIGGAAGHSAKNVNFSTMLGYAAGRFVDGASYSFIAGYAAAEYAHNSKESTFIGSYAGYSAADAPISIMIGNMAGGYAGGAASSQFYGYQAGQSARKSTFAIYMGENTGRFAANTKNVVLIGTGAEAEPGIENSIGLGAGVFVAKSNQVVIGNSDTEETHLGGTVYVDEICIGQTCLDEAALADLLKLVR